MSDASGSPRLDLGPLAAAARRSLNGDNPGEVGTRLPPLVDHHVHLMLVGVGAFAGSGLSGVVDLGAPLPVVAAARGIGMPRVDFAGWFLTAPGGYPTGRPWAVEGCVREVAAETGEERWTLAHPAETAVSELHSFGASVVKVALNLDAGPVFDRPTLDAIVAAAHERGLPVVAHVEGDGMTRLAVEAGVDVLAHTPFTEAVDDDLVARAAAAGQRWISTLHIHGHGAPSDDLERAVDNLRRFRAAGGRVLYGTDLGNGDQPVGVNAGELAALARAGLGASELLAALADPWPRDERVDAVATFVPGPPPERLDDVPAWLAAAVVVPAEELDPVDDSAAA
ncbi:hypothetical protein ACGGZK_05895 [Agromyces sp. MMS24-K17]|uniref:amidohydrolase family protein n=1 Tax=Agromyces sp. MMS24-K17 TaxID=3372850 RepID=UPI003754218A